jgi:hypothetical protein
MSRRPAQLTERDERDLLLVELGRLTGEYELATGKFPPCIRDLKRYENSDRIDFRGISNDDLMYLAQRIVAGC